MTAQRRVQFFVPVQCNLVDADDNCREADNGMDVFRAHQSGAMGLNADTNDDLVRGPNAGAYYRERCWDCVQKKFVTPVPPNAFHDGGTFHVKAPHPDTLDSSPGSAVMYKRWLSKNEELVPKRKGAVRDGLAVEAVAPTSRAR